MRRARARRRHRAVPRRAGSAGLGLVVQLRHRRAAAAGRGAARASRARGSSSRSAGRSCRSTIVSAAARSARLDGRAGGLERRASAAKRAHSRPRPREASREPAPQAPRPATTSSSAATAVAPTGSSSGSGPRRWPGCSPRASGLRSREGPGGQRGPGGDRVRRGAAGGAARPHRGRAGRPADRRLAAAGDDLAREHRGGGSARGAACSCCWATTTRLPARAARARQPARPAAPAAPDARVLAADRRAPRRLDEPGRQALRAALEAGRPAPPAVLEISTVHEDPTFVLAPGHDASLLAALRGARRRPAGRSAAPRRRASTRRCRRSAPTPSACPSSTRFLAEGRVWVEEEALELLQEIREEHAPAAGLVALSAAEDADARGRGPRRRAEALPAGRGRATCSTAAAPSWPTSRASARRSRRSPRCRPPTPSRRSSSARPTSS